MEHLDKHPHAFIDKDNMVLNVAVFNGHDEDLIELIKSQHEGAVASICCCNYGLAGIGAIWNNEKQRFCNSEGIALPLTERPLDIINEEQCAWVWKESTKTWVNMAIISETN